MIDEKRRELLAFMLGYYQGVLFKKTMDAPGTAISSQKAYDSGYGIWKFEAHR